MTTKIELIELRDTITKMLDKKFIEIITLCEREIRKQGGMKWRKYQKHLQTMEHSDAMKEEVRRRFSEFLPLEVLCDQWEPMAVLRKFSEKVLQNCVDSFLKENNLNLQYDNTPVANLSHYQLWYFIETLSKLEIESLPVELRDEIEILVMSV